MSTDDPFVPHARPAATQHCRAIVTPCNSPHVLASPKVSKNMGKTKEHISLVVIGHVDSGKSTTTGYVVFVVRAAVRGRLLVAKPSCN
jgi:GTPase